MRGQQAISNRWIVLALLSFVWLVWGGQCWLRVGSIHGTTHTMYIIRARSVQYMYTVHVYSAYILYMHVMHTVYSTRYVHTEHSVHLSRNGSWHPRPRPPAPGRHPFRWEGVIPNMIRRNYSEYDKKESFLTEWEGIIPKKVSIRCCRRWKERRGKYY
jgi:hypothetical protein